MKGKFSEITFYLFSAGNLGRELYLITELTLTKKSQDLRDMRISAINAVSPSGSWTLDFMKRVILANMTLSYIKIHRK